MRVRLVTLMDRKSLLASEARLTSDEFKTFIETRDLCVYWQRRSSV